MKKALNNLWCKIKYFFFPSKRIILLLEQENKNLRSALEHLQIKKTNMLPEISKSDLDRNFQNMWKRIETTLARNKDNGTAQKVDAPLASR